MIDYQSTDPASFVIPKNFVDYVDYEVFDELLELVSTLVDQVNELKIHNKSIEDRIKILETWKDI